MSDNKLNKEIRVMGLRIVTQFVIDEEKDNAELPWEKVFILTSDFEANFLLSYADYNSCTDLFSDNLRTIN